jgi:serine/threonine-protein kinase
MYMSPEQGQGLEVDRRTDIYSLGIVLYELLTGDVPFKADTPMAVVVKHMTAAMPMPRDVNPEIPEELEQLILKATAKNPEDRYQTAKAMAAALEEALENLSQAQQSAPAIPESTETLPSESKFKIKPLHLGILAALILVILGLGFLSGQASNLGVALGLGGTDTPTIIQIDASPTPLPSSTPTPTSTVLPSSTPTLTATQLPTSTTVPTLGAGSEKISPVDDMTMLYVPAGEFIMGASEDEDWASDDQRPQHTVYLDAFWIDQTEVTNAMYAAFLNDRGNQREGGAYWLDAESAEVLIVQSEDKWQPKDGYADHPVLEVTWYGARAYCDWAGRRLPSEAEWEKAARGTDGRRFAWGDDYPWERNCKYLWADSVECGGAEPLPVGSLPLGASPYGAFNMHGNVREWVQDLYGENYYAVSVLDNPKGPSSGSYRVWRGGDWKYHGYPITTRHSSNPVVSNNLTGFRCAADVAP